MTMMLRVAAVAASLVLSLACFGARAESVKVGILVTTTGPYAQWGKDYQQGVGLYLDEHNGKGGNPEVDVIYRDVGGDNPPRARQLAQELVVRDGVAALGGLEFTTTVLAVSDVINEAKIPFVIFNSATSFVTTKSPYFVRPTFTQWETGVVAADWAAKQGMKSAVIISADYAPGEDAINAFTKGMDDSGGKVTDVIKVPLGTTDFSSYLQRINDDAPKALYVFMPLGPMSVGIAKGFAERGFEKQMTFITNAVPERDLPPIGDAAIGSVAVLPYLPYVDNPTNAAFRAAFQAKYGADQLPTFATVAAYDGMELIFRMLKATHGKRDADAMMAAVKGYAWQSPRGPVSIDPQTREMIQNIYIARVAKVDGKLINKVIDTVPDVKDPWHQMNPAK